MRSQFSKKFACMQKKVSLFRMVEIFKRNLIWKQK